MKKIKEKYFVIRTASGRYLNFFNGNEYLFDCKSSRKCKRFESENEAKKALNNLIENNTRFPYHRARSNLVALKTAQIVDLRKEPFKLSFAGKKFKSPKWLYNYCVSISGGYNDEVCFGCKIYIPANTKFFILAEYKICPICIKKITDQILNTPEFKVFEKEYNTAAFLHALVK